MKCFYNFESNSVICSLILFGCGCFITLVGVLIIVFVYQAFRRRRESEGSLEHFDYMEPLDYSVMPKVTGTGEESDRDDSDMKASTQEKKEYVSQWSEVTKSGLICEGDSRLMGREISEYTSNSDDPKDDKDSMDRERKRSTVFSLESSCDTICVDMTSMDSLERKRMPMGVQLSMSIIDSDKHIFKSSSSSDNVTYFRSPTIKNGIILYNSENQQLRLFPNLVNLATHFVPSHSIIDFIKNHNTLDTKLNTNLLAGTKEGSVKTSYNNPFSFPRRRSLISRFTSSVTENGNQSASYTVPCVKSLADAALDDLEKYVPQFIISICITSIINKK